MEQHIYIYGNVVRKYVKIGNYMMVSSNYTESQRKVIEMMSLDARNSVEKWARADWSNCLQTIQEAEGRFSNALVIFYLIFILIFFEN